MIGRYLIDCRFWRPDLPLLPISVVCGSALTVGVTGMPQKRLGVKIVGCRIRITNADGQAETKDCVWTDGAWCVTFPASHFQGFGAVLKGVLVMAVGKDEQGADQVWVERMGDLRVLAAEASSRPGQPSEIGGDVYCKSKVIDGVQHYKKEVLTYSEKQKAWGSDWVGDYIIIGGEYVPANVEG